VPQRNVFHWIDGRGWLVLAGSADSSNDIRALALAKSAADGGVAFVSLGAGMDHAEAVLYDLEDLGAAAGYIVDVTTEDDTTVTAKLTETSVVVIEAAPSAEDARSSLLGAAAEGIQAAYENGAVVLAEGQSAMVFGAWIVRQNGELASGLEWLSAAIVAAGVTNAGAWARDVLSAEGLAYVVGIGAGTALALGPDGQLEIWGKGEVTVALGRSLTSGAEDSTG
jgi:hypothetical protein